MNLSALCQERMIIIDLDSDIDKIEHREEFDVFIKGNEVLSFNQILNSEKPLFSKRKQSNLSQKESVIWSRFILRNSTDRSFSGSFGFNKRDGFMYYYILDKDLNLQSFDTIPPARAVIDFSVESQDEKVIYIKYEMNTPVAVNSLLKFALFTSKGIRAFFLRQAISFYAYGGAMIVLGLFGFFLSWVFRDLRFLYFALLTFCFVFYWAAQDRQIPNYLFRIALSGVIVFGYFFCLKFLSLKYYVPIFSRVFKWLSFFLAIFSIVHLFFRNEEWAVGHYMSYGIILWLLLIILIAIFLSFRNVKSARSFLLSSTFLLLGSLTFIGMQAGIIPNNFITYNGMKIGSFLFSGILFISLFGRINEIREKTSKLEALDVLKTRFFTNISHEFRTPLTLVLGPLKQLLDRDINQDDKNTVNLAYSNANRLLNLVNQLLDISKLEAGKMKLSLQKKDIVSLLKRITMSFESLANSKNISLHFKSSSDEIPIFIDVDKIEKIFYNLFSNAFKFTKGGDEVSIEISEDDQKVNVVVSDSGIGISKDELPHIYNRFFQVDRDEEHSNPGSGVGLSLVNEYILLSKGTIDVVSEEGKGTEFYISFLKGRNCFSEESIEQNDSDKHTDISLENKSDYQKLNEVDLLIDVDNSDLEHLPFEESVLIVEDSHDIRNYIKSQIQKKYRILEAMDGLEGESMAIEHLPNLIISDIMMPEKNGYDLCESLKLDKRTSHIPIILLTAKASQREKNRGLEIGADDYLVKPFDSRELELRVDNLLESRKLLRKLYTDLDNFQINSHKINSVDRAFIESIFENLQNNFSDVSFGVTQLALLEGMSKPSLNRKLRALTDHSSNNFIQSFRLMKASKMLKEKSGNVSEVAFKSGFSSTSYFVKCFKDKYGKTPGSLV